MKRRRRPGEPIHVDFRKKEVVDHESTPDISDITEEDVKDAIIRLDDLVGNFLEDELSEDEQKLSFDDSVVTVQEQLFANATPELLQRRLVDATEEEFEWDPVYTAALLREVYKRGIAQPPSHDAEIREVWSEALADYRPLSDKERRLIDEVMENEIESSVQAYNERVAHAKADRIVQNFQELEQQMNDNQRKFLHNSVNIFKKHLTHVDKETLLLLLSRATGEQILAQAYAMVLVAQERGYLTLDE